MWKKFNVCGCFTATARQIWLSVIRAIASTRRASIRDQRAGTTAAVTNPRDMWIRFPP
jgi:hypothetical protein